MPQSRTRRHDWVPITVAMVGLVVACVAAVLIGTPPTAFRGDAAANNFLSAWHRSRTSPYVIDAAVTRTLPDGQQIQWQQHDIRRPPDRLFIGLGTVEGRLGPDIVRCGSDPGGTSKCFQTPANDTFDDEVVADDEQLRREVTGPDPLYTVLGFDTTAGTHCFRLVLAKQFPAPPFGDNALFCFDVASGAPVLTVIEQPEGVTRAVANRPVRTDVTDGDLAIPADRGAVVGLGGK